MFLELNERESNGLTVSLEWDRETGATRVVVLDARNASRVVVPVAAAHAGDAFLHPFRYML